MRFLYNTQELTQLVMIKQDIPILTLVYLEDS